MVNGTVSVPPVRRREIDVADVPSLVDLFAAGFPGRPRRYWARGLSRMAGRVDVPPGCPRFGVLLEADGRPVGALLMLFRDVGGRILCNLSSWTVEPAFRVHAPLLVAAALRRRDVTFLNLSPAPHTWPIVAAQGFTPLPSRIEVRVPRPWRYGSGAVSLPGPGAFAGLADAALLEDHLGYGCLVRLVATPAGPEPFVFLPLRMRSGRIPLPLAQLVYCRDIADYRRHADALGRSLLRRGIAGVVVDASGSATPWNRIFVGRRRRKYIRGPDLPRPGDLAYTERVIFGA